MNVNISVKFHENNFLFRKIVGNIGERRDVRNWILQCRQ